MKDIKSVFLNNRFFLLGGMLCVLLVFSYFFPLIQTLSKITILVFGIISILELFLLFKVKKGVHGFRFTPEKLSNGDDNEIKIYLENFYPFEVRLRVMDELPEQFQKRDVNFYLTLKPRENKSIVYNVRPVKRGEYFFGAVNVFVSSGFGLISRRERLSADIMVPVYPSYIQMRKYELLAISNNLVNAGIKKIRKIGHNLEFEQIKEYVSGDDFRT
ncbi:MAG: DUF58 domain-containing protein, partial [Cyclobacteriaceae bacterium]|nr:DUF58 domain-containing protein [Cyclobacteriaceae bacterium]